MPKCRIDGAVCIRWAILILLLPLKWVLAAFCAAAFHEGCHWLAVAMLGGRVYNLRLTPSGAVMETSAMEPWQELICALAGPLGGILLLALSRYAPRLALCAVCQSTFNLLPIYPLDGGRALRAGLQLTRRPKNAEKAEKWVAGSCLSGIVLVLMGLWWHLRAGIFPLIALILAARTAFVQKFLANIVRRDYNRKNHEK